MKTILSACFGALIGGGIIWATTALPVLRQEANGVHEFIPVNWTPERTATPTPPALPLKAAATPMVDLRDAARESINAVVHVKTISRTMPSYNPWMDFWGIPNAPRVRQGSGSGVIIDSQGFILTNHHVIDGADRIEVSLNDRRSFEALVVGTDPGTDLAVLRIEQADDLPALRFGSSDELEVGEWVLAVGNPFDLTSTVTAGIVSAKARSLQLLRPDYRNEVFPVESFIQTDAAVNPGNSGGALVNVAGQLVGINTAIASETGNYAGYAFAVPASIAQKVSRDLIAYGRVQRAFIGISGAGVTPELAEELGLDAVQGVWIHSLSPEGGAEDAGIEAGDILLRINGQAVNSIAELQEEVARHDPGDLVSVEIFGRDRPIQVQLRDVHGGTEVKDRLQWNRERT
jgi:S1-C subfamily serine protease